MARWCTQWTQTVLDEMSETNCPWRMHCVGRKSSGPNTGSRKCADWTPWKLSWYIMKEFTCMRSDLVASDEWIRRSRTLSNSVQTVSKVDHLLPQHHYIHGVSQPDPGHSCMWTSQVPWREGISNSDWCSFEVDWSLPYGNSYCLDNHTVTKTAVCSVGNSRIHCVR